MDERASKLWQLILAIKLFYIAFIVLGVGVGLIVGFFLWHIIIFAIFGFIIGLGLGILANAILIAIKVLRH